MAKPMAAMATIPAAIPPTIAPVLIEPVSLLFVFAFESAAIPEVLAGDELSDRGVRVFDGVSVGVVVGRAVVVYLRYIRNSGWKDVKSMHTGVAVVLGVTGVGVEEVVGVDEVVGVEVGVEEVVGVDAVVVGKLSTGGAEELGGTTTVTVRVSSPSPSPSSPPSPSPPSPSSPGRPPGRPARVIIDAYQSESRKC